MSVKLNAFGFKDALVKYQEMGGKVDEAAEAVLLKTSKRVTKELQSGIRKHRKTGRTEENLKDSPKVEKSGKGVFSVSVGFKLPEGLPARYINAGPNRTTRRGTPNQMPKDAFVDRALNKTKIRKEYESFFKELGKR